MPSTPATFSPAPNPAPSSYPPAATTAPTSAPPTPMPSSNPPPTAPSSAPLTPAVGFACTSDADLQCPFAHCTSGRCGGCRNDAECKPGSKCFGTPLGAACMPSANAPTATPAPTPSTAPSATPPPSATTPAPAAPDLYAAARARCLQRTNEYRARLGAVALGSRADQLTCTDGQGRRDAEAQKPHSAFGQCNESAQNECPAFKGTPDAVVDRCLELMFGEGPGDGPGHGHYANMTNASYHSLVCGFYTAADGSTWLVQNYYR